MLERNRWKEIISNVLRRIKNDVYNKAEMRLFRYIPLLGLKSRDSELPNNEVTPATIPTTTSTVTTNYDKTKQKNEIEPVQNIFPYQQNGHNHHSHQQFHKKHTNEEIHPTLKARAAHLDVKEKAYERIGQQVLQKRGEEPKLDYRPLIITNNLKDETIYPGFSSKELSGGFELAPGQSHTVKLPVGSLNMFRAWIRRGCTKGNGENDLTCIHGDCNGKLRCEGWPLYGVSALENAIFPVGNPPGSWLDYSNVEGITMLPIALSMDDCMTITCDPTGVICPEDMKVKDKDGKLLACSCGYSDWLHLLSDCPNDPPLSDVQNQWMHACPDVYSYSSNDAVGQKYCPYDETNAMRIDVGIKDDKPINDNQQVVKNDEKNEEKKDTSAPQVTPAPPILFQNSWTESPEWKEFVKNYKWDGKAQ